MIDNLALLVSHGLLILTVWKLVRRPDLDSDEVGDAPEGGFLRRGPGPHA